MNIDISKLINATKAANLDPDAALSAPEEPVKAAAAATKAERSAAPTEQVDSTAKPEVKQDDVSENDFMIVKSGPKNAAVSNGVAAQKAVDASAPTTASSAAKVDINSVKSEGSAEPVSGSDNAKGWQIDGVPYPARSPYDQAKAELLAIDKLGEAGAPDRELLEKLGDWHHKYADFAPRLIQEGQVSSSTIELLARIVKRHAAGKKGEGNANSSFNTAMSASQKAAEDFAQGMSATAAGAAGLVVGSAIGLMQGTGQKLKRAGESLSRKADKRANENVFSETVVPEKINYAECISQVEKVSISGQQLKDTLLKSNIDTKAFSQDCFKAVASLPQETQDDILNKFIVHSGNVTQLKDVVKTNIEQTSAMLSADGIGHKTKKDIEGRALGLSSALSDASHALPGVPVNAAIAGLGDAESARQHLRDKEAEMPGSYDNFHKETKETSEELKTLMEKITKMIEKIFAMFGFGDKPSAEAENVVVEMPKI
jgi:hypothetical protein